MSATKTGDDTVHVTSAEKRIIMGNVAAWQQKRRRREKVIEGRNFVRHFNSVGDTLLKRGAA